MIRITIATLAPVVRSLRISPQSRQTDRREEKAVRIRMKTQPKKMIAMILGLARRMSSDVVLRLWHFGQGRLFFSAPEAGDDGGW